MPSPEYQLPVFIPQHPPRTPSFSHTETPNLSSPDTPHPKTPHGRNRYTGEKVITPTKSTVKGMVGDEIGFGKGKGKGIGSGKMDGLFGPIGVGMGREGSRSSSASGSGSGGAESPKIEAIAEVVVVEKVEIIDLPSDEELRRMQRRLVELDGEREWVEDDGAERDELRGMVDNLLNPTIQQLPYLRQQITAQRDTIVTMQEQSRLAEQLMRVERDRHTAERAGWQAETRALVKVRDAEIAAGTRPKRLLELNVGYHQELEAANKRLEMDNRLMAPRLADTQRQIDKLVTELRHLRSHVILSTQPLSSNHPPMLSSRLERSPGKPITSTTLGDARTEHLLLAARRVRALRQHDERVGRLTLDELKRGGVVGPEGGLGYSEGYGENLEEHEEEDYSEVDEKPDISSDRRGKGKPLATPFQSKKKGTKKPPQPPTTPSRASRTAQLPPTTTPGGSNFSDLLRAAEMAHTRPVRPENVPMSAMSATRSTTRVRDRESGDERGSPNKRVRREGDAKDVESEKKDEKTDEQESSALDILAQASQLEVAQAESPQLLASAVRFEGMLEDQSDLPASPRVPELSLAPAIDLRGSSTQPAIEDDQIDPTLTSSDPQNLPEQSPVPSSVPLPILSTPKLRPRTPSFSGSDIHTPARQYNHPYDDETPMTLFRAPSPDLPLGAYASPTGGTVPGLGKYVHLTSSMPARRIRSPYLKWTVEEDELLARAVALHGEKWDLVSKGVPTRSYHQVRQRWLRKTGAFDKKPGSEMLHGGSSLVDEDEETSPTPQPQATPGLKKRKV